MSFDISFALLTVLIIQQWSLKEWQTDLICQIIHSNVNNNVASAVKSYLYIIIKSLNLIDNRVLHTMIAILCALYMFYVTDMTLKLTYSSYTYFVLDIFQYKQENMYRP